MNTFSREQMKQYLYGEMPETEAQNIETRLFADEEFFYELTCLENDLIDQYVQGRLKGEELNRFEKSLSISDERTTQVENARALQRYIKEQKAAATSINVSDASPQSSHRSASGLLGFKKPARRYAMAGLAIFLAIFSVWLLYDNFRARQGLSHQQIQQSRREDDLLQKIEEAQRQIERLQRQLDEQSSQNKAMLAQLAERDMEMRQIERELIKSRRQKNGSRDQTMIFISPPTIRSTGGSRGGTEPRIVAYNLKSVTVRLELETETDYKSYEARANQKPVNENLKALIESGKKYLNITLPARTITFSIWGLDKTRGIEKELAVYELVVKRAK